MNTLYSFLSGIIICSLLNMTSILKSTVDEINELREHNENIILLRQYEANESSLYPLTEYVPVNESMDDNSDSIEVSLLHNVTASDSEGGK
ncbi:hypothetical protein EGC79_11655 [Shewanella vesiculosa]|uniref:hypothetical protein n=1 Tax=Shewanella vesiculosa TaxID=518738 RepID=UPI000F4D726A|nr:hypothetical protein [Shewanella vesiculosa]RPA50730.1 hypothetical protein EGC79_11655 [Shewanella vesiculosa]UJL44277.1 hypothetical protein KDH10_001752 [Shewanella vesiculosa]|tara:strand:- start:1495 stop:1767 length:273 start_codon:yes stop_codon:yes gene_type:complete